MSKETVVAILTFLAAVATLASKTLPITPEAQAVLAFAVLVISAGISSFFTATAIKARAARIEAQRITAQAMARLTPVIGCGAAGRAAPTAPQAVKKPDGAR